MKKLIFYFFLPIVLYGCVGAGEAQEESNSAEIFNPSAIGQLLRAEAEAATAKCVDLCRAAQINGADLHLSPCLGDPIPGSEMWVCDIANNPRQDIDNEKNNQCAEYRNGNAKHFVELTSDCGFIRAL